MSIGTCIFIGICSVSIVLQQADNVMGCMFTKSPIKRDDLVCFDLVANGSHADFFGCSATDDKQLQSFMTYRTGATRLCTTFSSLLIF